jgi:hypothetical protein
MDGGHCHGVTASGKPCSAKALPDDHFCPWHSPQWAGRRKEWSAKGGRNRSTKARAAKAVGTPQTAKDLLDLLFEAIIDVYTGAITPRVATACARVARAIIDVMLVADLEARLTELQNEFAALVEADDRKNAEIVGNSWEMVRPSSGDRPTRCRAVPGTNAHHRAAADRPLARKAG